MADDAVEVSVNWKPGDMLANPAANLVYVVNETDGDFLAISTETGNVVAHKRFDYNTDGATIFLSLDESELFVSLPGDRKLYTLNPATLTEIGMVEPEVRIESFVIDKFGFLYTHDDGNVGWDDFVKIDPSTGEVDFRLTNTYIRGGSLFRLNEAGDAVYVLTRGLSGGAGLVLEFATSAGTPSFVGSHFDDTSNDSDLSVDDSNDRLYRASGGYSGVVAWNIAAETQEFWPFGGAPYGTAVSQLPGSTSVWGGSGSSYGGVLMEFDKATGNPIRTIQIGEGNSDLEDGSLMPGLLEITSNGRLLYGKSDWTGNSDRGVDGYYYNIGFTDVSSATIHYAPSSEKPFAPVEVSASDETYNDQVEVEWSESIRATGYQIFRNTVDDSDTATQIGSVTAPTTLFVDSNAETETQYFYWVRAINDSGVSPFSRSDSGSVLLPPDAPTNFTASDGTYVDRVYVSRSYVSGISGFRVYRSVTNDFASAIEVGSSVTTGFDDLSAIPGQRYFYWARLENAAGLGEVSSSEVGHAGDFDPPQTAPASVTAADGTNPFDVDVTWGGVAGARGYEIFRHTSSNSADATLIGSTTTSRRFDDTTAQELITYYYWVRAVNTAGPGPLSNPDTGFRAELTAPPPPGYVIAGDGSYYDRVALSWGSSQYADEYTLYRSTINNSATANEITTTSSRAYSDDSVIPGVTYFYWVKAANSAGSSTFSSGDSGHATVPPPPTAPPTGVAATDGWFEDKVRVSWGLVAYAKDYKVFRATTDNPSLATLIHTTSDLAFEDYSAIPLETYYYWIKAANYSGETGFSASDPGYSSVGVTRSVYATDDLFDSMVRVTWNSVNGAARYRVYRHTGSSSSGAVLLGSVDAPALRFEDHTSIPGQNYYYWVLTELSGGQLSEFDSSARDTGRRASSPTSGSNFVAVEEPRDVEFDMHRGKAYITASKGIVEVYDLVNRDVVNDEWNTDGGLSGADLGPNNQFLLLAQTRITGADNKGWVDLIDLSTNSLTSFGYTRDPYEIGAYDVTFLNENRALVTTGFAGSGWTPFRKLETVDGTFTIIESSGSSFGSDISQNSLLSRTPDRSTVLVQENNISSGPFFLYDTASEQSEPPVNMEGFQRRGSISPDGSMVAMVNYPDVEIRSSVGGGVIETLKDLKSGIVFDGLRPLLFAVDTDNDRVRVYSTDTWEVVDDIEIGRPISYLPSKYSEGHIVIDPTSSWLALTFEEGVKIFDVSSYPFPLPQAPFSLTASDNATDEGIEISWQSSLGAVHYQLWRSSTDDFATASQIVSNLVGREYLDTTVDAGSIFYYWARGTNSTGTGPESISDGGERRISAPADLSATASIDLETISLGWSASVSAVDYSVFRSSSSEPETAVEISSGITQTSFDDTTLGAETTYYYWVVARNDGGSSVMGGPRSISRELDAPTNITIDTEDSAFVALNWSEVGGATSYRIFRSDTDDSNSAVEIGQTSSRVFEDASAIPGRQYHWYVQAKRDMFQSDKADGHISGIRIFPAPVDFSASQEFPDRILLSWSEVEGLVSTYEVVRSSGGDVSGASPIGEGAETLFSDLNAPMGSTAYFWVRAKSATTLGEWSEPVTGLRLIDSFEQYTAKMGLSGGDALPGGDPDYDNIDTVIEWLQGASDPYDGSSRPSIVTGTYSIDDSDYLCLSYLRLVGGAENSDTYEHVYGTYQVVGTQNLSLDQWDQTCITIEPPLNLAAAPDGYEWGCFRLPFSTAQSETGFMKLLLSVPDAR